MSAAKVAHAFGGDGAKGESGTRQARDFSHIIRDGTRGWDKESVKSEENLQKKLPVGRPEVNLSEIEWAVVYEADVPFGTPASVSICLPFLYLHRTDPTSLIKRSSS